MKEDKKIIPFEIKSEDITEEGIFTGYASTFGGKADSYGDVIREGAFVNTIKSGGRNGNGIALLWQHNAADPAGIWLELSENPNGLKAVGKLEIGSEQGKRYHNLLKMGAIKGLSIGWDFPRDGKGMVIPGSVEYDKEMDVRYLNQVELWEISLVTFPANTRANITNVKSLIENATNERELEMALRDECNMSINAAKYIVGLCKEKIFSRGKFFTEEELQKIIDDKVKEEIKKSNEKLILNQLKKIK